MWIQCFLVGESEWATELCYMPEYRVYTSHATVYTELEWPLLSFPHLFPLSFLLGCNMTFMHKSKGCMK